MNAGRRLAPVLKALALAGLATGVQGCWPAWKTTQGERSFQVLGEAGDPLASATVAYITLRYPYGLEDRREIGVTGADGRTAFKARREWQGESLMIHGSNAYAWRWCVSAPGHETFRSQQVWKFAGEEVVVRLKRGESKPCSTGSERFIQPSAAPLEPSTPRERR